MIKKLPHHKWVLRRDHPYNRPRNGDCLTTSLATSLTSPLGPSLAMPLVVYLAIHLVCALLSGLIISIPQSAHAQDKEAVSDTQAESFSSLMLQKDDNLFVLSPYMSLIPDQPGKTTLDTITTIHQRGAYRLNKDDYQIHLPGNGLAYWLVLSIENTSDITKWVLDMGDLTRGRMGVVKEIFIYDHTYRKILKNLLLPQNANEAAKTSSPFFEISLPANSQSEISIFISTHQGIHTILSPRLIPQDIWYESFTRHLPALLIIMAVSFLALGLILTGHIYTSWLSRLCMTGSVLSVLTSLRLNQQDFLTQNDLLAYMELVFIGIGIFLSYLANLFQCHNQSHIHSALSRLTGVIILSAASIIAAIYLAPIDYQMLGYFAAGFIILIAMIYMCLLPKSNQVTLGHTLSAIALFIGYVIYACENLNIIPPSNFGPAAFAAGFVVQLIILILLGRQDADNGWSPGAFTSKKDKHTDNNEDNGKKSLLIALQKIKENSDYQKLLKVVERERITMHELREKEAERVEQMRKSKDEADLANRAKSAFLAMVSHEIRTPMTGIMGMVSLLKDTQLSNQQDDYIDTIQESSKTMLSLLNDILDFEKIETGQMELEIVDFDLHRVIQSVISLMNGHASVKHNQLLTNMGNNVPKYVRGDPTRLRQVILNLVGNAIKFTSNGTITLNVQNLQDGDQPDDNNQYDIYFSVEDTGIGIPREAQKNLFNPFVQADKSTSRKYGGSGLGLAISQKLIGAMGGFISVNSREGVGSTFFFSIMLSGGDQKRAQDIDNKQASKTNLPGYDEIKRNQYRQTQSRIPAPPPISETLENTTNQSIATPNAPPISEGGAAQKDNAHISKNILVIDDNAINRKVLSGLISRLNHHVALAESGRQGVDMAQEKIWDLIFMDIEMPDISGVDATIQILSNPDHEISQTPIIALTGNMRDQDTAAYIQAGMRASLGKPVDPDKLKDIIDAYPHRTATPKLEEQGDQDGQEDQEGKEDQESQESQGSQGGEQGGSGLAPQAAHKIEPEIEPKIETKAITEPQPLDQHPQKQSGEISDQAANNMFASDDADDLNDTEMFRPKQSYEARMRDTAPAPLSPQKPQPQPEDNDTHDNFYEDDLGKQPEPTPLEAPAIFATPINELSNTKQVTTENTGTENSGTGTEPATTVTDTQQTQENQQSGPEPLEAPQTKDKDLEPEKQQKPSLSKNILTGGFVSQPQDQKSPSLEKPVQSKDGNDLEREIEEIERKQREKKAKKEHDSPSNKKQENEGMLIDPPDIDPFQSSPAFEPVSDAAPVSDTGSNEKPSSISLDMVKTEVESQPPFHTDVLAVLADNLKPADLKQLIDDFWIKTNESIAFLQNPKNWEDMAKIRHAAHDIKGMAGNFGLMQISVLGGFIEDVARDENLNKIKLFIGELSHYFPDGKAALTKWLDDILSKSTSSSSSGDQDSDTDGNASGDQTSPALFNPDILDIIKQSMSGPQLTDYLKGFCAKIEGEINSLRASISIPDIAGSTKQAQEIYLMAQNFGLIKIQKLAEDIKSLLTSSSPSPTADMMQNLNAICDDLSITTEQTRLALQEWVGEAPPPSQSPQAPSPMQDQSQREPQELDQTQTQTPAAHPQKPVSNDLDYDMLELLKDSMNTTQIISMMNTQWKETNDIIDRLDAASHLDNAELFASSAQDLIDMCDKLGLIALGHLAQEAKQAGQENDLDRFTLLSGQITAKAKSARESLDKWIRT